MERRRLWVETTPAVPCERQNCWIWVMSRQGCVFNMAQKALRWLATVWIYLPWIAMDPRISVTQMLRCIQRLGRTCLGFSNVFYSRMAQAQKAPRTHGSRYTELFGGFTVSHDAYAFSSWSHFRKQGVGWVHQAVLRRDKRRDRQADSAGHVKAARRPWTNPFTAPYRSDAWMGFSPTKHVTHVKYGKTW